MNVIIGITIATESLVPESRFGDHSPCLPMPKLRTFRHERAISKRLLQTKVIQHASTIRAQLDAGSDILKLCGLFEYSGPAASLRQR